MNTATDEARIDQAIAAVGGGDTEFYLDGCGGPAGVEHAVRLTCRYQGCEWGEFVGEMELWEFVTDARKHWDETHAASVAVARVVNTPVGGKENSNEEK